MELSFVKYHGSGNDFILMDDRSNRIQLSTAQIKQLCHRHFGIGSDGLILLRNHPDCDYEMVFYNPDGSQSLCGNGSRCTLDFANKLGLVKKDCTFLAIDGKHDAHIENEQMCIRLHDINTITRGEDFCFLNNGSPHHVQFVMDVDKVNLSEAGPVIRHREIYKPGGTNVNFVERLNTGIRSRVYERGVEAETFSSGTGTVAQAICAHHFFGLEEETIQVTTRGGMLNVAFDYNGQTNYENIWLKGPVTEVYSGTVEI